MTSPSLLPWCLLAALVGAAVAALATHARAVRREARLRADLAAAHSAARSEEAMLDAFRSTAATAAREQSEDLLRTAERHWDSHGAELLRTLERHAAHIKELEATRRVDASAVRDAVDRLQSTNAEVRAEVSRLAGALDDTSVRGTWGEVQLRRLLEAAGMLAHVDYVEQRTYAGPDGSSRPDVVVRLPNDHCVVIDAKAPLEQFLAAARTDEPGPRSERLVQHGRAVANHVSALASRRYEEVVGGSVDLVVLFVPGDAFLTAAFEGRPGLLEEAARQRIVLASPSTLLAFLHGVAAGWNERRVAEQAEVIAALGREMHERIAVFAQHFTKVGGSLGRAVRDYNNAMASLEGRLLVTARRFDELGTPSGRTLPAADTLEEIPAEPTAVELVEARTAAQEGP